MKRVICGGCGNNCGLIIQVKDGNIINIKGDPNDPFSQGHVCEKAIATVKLLNHKDRLRYPLKRVGEKGGGKWERISWDQAIHEISEKLKDIKERYGPESIALVHGHPRGLDYILRRFMNLLGSPNMFGPAGQVCWDNTALLECITYGWMTISDLENAQCIVEWGSNPASSNRVRWRKILDAKKRGVRLIVIDPRLTLTAQKADVWLQLRPGTDCAMAMGWLNVIINEKLYDEQFVRNWTIGFEELKKRVQKYSLEKVANITGVPAEKIEEAARLYATVKPSTITWGVSLDHIGRNASQAIRARAILRAITGNLDVKGGDLLTGLHPTLVSETEIEENEKLPEDKKNKLIGVNKFRLCSWNVYDSLDNYAERIGFRRSIPSYSLIHAHTPTVWRAILTGKPYPVEAVICIASNPLVTCANTKLVYQALKKLELLVVHDIFLTPTAMLADYVLPATTWLERPHMDTYTCGDYVIGGDKAVEPLEETKSEFDFLRELGVSLGQEWPWKSLEELYEYRLKPIGYSWKDFVEKVRWVLPDRQYKKYEKTGFATPSGKVEIYSTILEKLGYDPLPACEDFAECTKNSLAPMKEYPLILITGGRISSMFHSMGRQIDLLRKLHPDPKVQINPETAKKFGIKDGDWVWIETHLGKIKQKAELTERIAGDVVHAEHGWWFPEMPGKDPILYGLWESNVNVIIDDDPEKCDQLIGSWPLRAIPCRIHKVAE
jgi:anaerobic selenocysteine-containing dehydrogenase